jgi:hypothetical protein
MRSGTRKEEQAREERAYNRRLKDNTRGGKETFESSRPTGERIKIKARTKSGMSVCNIEGFREQERRALRVPILRYEEEGEGAVISSTRGRDKSNEMMDGQHPGCNDSCSPHRTIERVFNRTFYKIRLRRG